MVNSVIEKDITFQLCFAGASKFGVYLCRNADVQLRLAEGKGLTNCTLVVFKVLSDQACLFRAPDNRGY